MNKITAIIPTFNEEENIEAAIASVSWADEIIVIDSYSTDNTALLAKKHPVRFVQNKFVGYGVQKNLAISKASHDWVFILDADERVPPALADEVKRVLKKGTDKAAFKIFRSNYFMGKRVRYSGWQNDAVIRLIRKGFNKYNDKEVHEEIESEGEVGQLKSRLEHYTYRGIIHYLEKFDRYTTLSAYDRLKKTKKVSWVHLAIKPLFRFIKQYFLKLGFLDGKVGFIISCMAAHSVFLRYLKADRIQKGEKLR